jgi:hypothetical protein
MTSRLGTYWSVMHRRASDYAYFKALQPSVFKIMDGGAPDYQFAKDNLPNSLVIARDWALSEQHSDMLREPMETGIRHAREWDEHQAKLGFDRDKTLILGINEPTVWEAGFPEALRIYTINFCEAANRRGLRVGAMQLGVGWPNNNGPDTPPDWAPWHGVEQAILSNGGALITHEYWADNGPSENWGWWGGRTLKCPWQVPIVIGECGVDMFVKDVSVGQQNRGWLGHMPPERYASELAEYVGRMSADTRFVGCCVFASDFAAHEWYSFDTEPAYKAILAMKIPDNKPPTPPTTTTMYVSVPSGARIRSAPVIRTDNILGAVAYGEPVIVTNYTADHSWAEAGYKDIRGWMSSALLSSVKPPVIPTTPPVPTPIPPAGDKWTRTINWVLQWEGGYQNSVADKGNWTGCAQGKGENKGTNFGISACSYPNLDIKNLTKQQAIDIYARDYWVPSGASELPWPYCLLVMDTAVLHGVGAAKGWLATAGPDPYTFAAKRLQTYTVLSNWDLFGKGWVNRTADLLEEMST